MGRTVFAHTGFPTGSIGRASGETGMSKYRAPHLRGLDAMLQQRNPLPVFREYGNRYTMHGWSSLVTQCLHVTKGLLLRQMTLVTRSRCRLRPVLNAKNTALEPPVFPFAESFYSKKSNLG